MPNTTTSQQLQRSYRSLFDRVIAKKEPLVVLNKNKPEVVIIDMQTFESLLKNSEEHELELAKKALKIYDKEEKTKKLKKRKS